MEGAYDPKKFEHEITFYREWFRKREEKD